MTVFQAEIKYFLRSPIIWFILAVTAFISAWITLLSIDIFTTTQVKFAGMADAPTIIQGIVFPILAAQGKLLIVISAIIGGLSFSRLAINNAWMFVLSSQHSRWHIVLHKYFANVLITLLFITPAVLAIFTLIFIAKLPFLPVLIALLGLLLLLMWMVAMCVLISSWVNNTGFAILLCIMVLALFMLIGTSSVDASWGKNWLQTVSPFYHFKQFNSHRLPYASLLYFVGDTVLCLWLCQIRLIHKRYSLS